MNGDQFEHRSGLGATTPMRPMTTAWQERARNDLHCGARLPGWGCENAHCDKGKLGLAFRQHSAHDVHGCHARCKGFSAFTLRKPAGCFCWSACPELDRGWAYGSAISYVLDSYSTVEPDAYQSSRYKQVVAAGEAAVNRRCSTKAPSPSASCCCKANASVSAFAQYEAHGHTALPHPCCGRTLPVPLLRRGVANEGDLLLLSGFVRKLHRRQRVTVVVLGSSSANMQWAGCTAPLNVANVSRQRKWQGPCIVGRGWARKFVDYLDAVYPALEGGHQLFALGRTGAGAASFDSSCR